MIFANALIVAALCGFFVLNIALAFDYKKIDTEIFSKIQAARVANGANELTRTANADRAAFAKLQDMAASGYFEHISPKGKTAEYFLDREKVSFVLNGENLARGFVDSGAVVDAWLVSPTHRENILDGRFNVAGIASGELNINGKTNTYNVLLLTATTLSGIDTPGTLKRGVNLSGISWPFTISVVFILLFIGIDFFFAERIYDEE